MSSPSCPEFFHAIHACDVIQLSSSLILFSAISYYPGESEFLQTLRMMGFESHASMLKQAGFRTVDDLCRDIDEAKLVLLCPNMKRFRRRLFLERLKKGRLSSFLSSETQNIASKIRSKFGVTPLVAPAAYATAEEQWERRLFDRYFFNLEGKVKAK